MGSRTPRDGSGGIPRYILNQKIVKYHNNIGTFPLYDFTIFWKSTEKVLKMNFWPFLALGKNFFPTNSDKYVLYFWKLEVLVVLKWYLICAWPGVTLHFLTPQNMPIYIEIPQKFLFQCKLNFNFGLVHAFFVWKIKNWALYHVQHMCWNSKTWKNDFRNFQPCDQCALVEPSFVPSQSRPLSCSVLD